MRSGPPPWIQIRLCLIGPALALSGLPVDLRASIAATRGQVWRILPAGLLLTALPVALFVLVAIWGFGSVSGGVPSGVGVLSASLLGVIVVVVTASCEAEICRGLKDCLTARLAP